MFLQVDRFYVAVVVAAPMVIGMLVAMHHTFSNTKLDIALEVGSAALFVAAFMAIRSHAFVGTPSCRGR